MSNAESEHRPWTREPLVWLLIGIPATAVVVMGMIMLTVAIQTWSGLVVDDYYKKGKQINRVLARDKFAYELGLAARLRILTPSAKSKFNSRPTSASYPASKSSLNWCMQLDRDSIRH